MKIIPSPTPKPDESVAKSGFDGKIPPTMGWPAIGVLLVAWGYVVYRLGPLWYSNPDYNYGWFVPLLSLSLFRERWKCRPPANPVAASTGALILFVLLAFTLLPVSLGLEANSDWRLAGWAFAGAVVGITFCVLYLLGGRSWPWHFSFPILFFLVAVPWHPRLEQPLIDHLSRLNAAASTGIANLLGTPAIQHGVVIETAGGLVDIDDACSGIRSLQATVMVALFLGELFRYTLPRRIFFLFASILLAFVCNVVRTTYLIHISDLKGNAAVTAYHDSAAITILAATLVGLLGLAWLLRPEKKHPPAESSAMVPSSPAIGQRQPGAQANSPPALLPRRSLCLQLLFAGLLMWVLLVELGIHVWFHSAEKRAVMQNRWSLQMPTEQPGFSERPLQESLRETLRFDEGSFAEWRQMNGAQWQLYYLRWRTPHGRYRAIESAHQARGHSTDLCLQLAGMELQKNFGSQLRDVNGVALLTRMERFLDQGQVIYVLSCYWEPEVAVLRSGVTLDSSMHSPIVSALREIKIGDRGGNEKRVLKIAVMGLETDAEAATAFDEYLHRIIQTEGGH
jgi:exosortase